MRYGMSRRTVLSLAVMLFAGSASLQAQDALSFQQAEVAMDAAEAEARANGWNLTILIADAAGVPVYLRRMDGAPVRTHEIASRKVITVLGSGLPSGEYGQKVQAGEIEEVPNAVTFEGGYPIRVNGEIVGAMSASGATGAQDAQVVRVGLAAIGLEP